VAGAEFVESSAPAVNVIFGHGARHLAGTGLEAAKVEGLIRAEVLKAVRGANGTGSSMGESLWKARSWSTVRTQFVPE
jgi:hypothetical protein